MEPFVKQYMSDDQLIHDIQALANKGVNKKDMYILTHDDKKTDHLAKESGANKIGLKETSFGNTIENIFNTKGDELRNKLQDIGITKQHSQSLESDMDEGKILLIINNNDFTEDYLM